MGLGTRLTERYQEGPVYTRHASSAPSIQKLRAASLAHSLHEMQDVQANLEILPSAKKLMEFGCNTSACTTIPLSVQNQRMWLLMLLISLHQTIG